MKANRTRAIIAFAMNEVRHLLRDSTTFSLILLMPVVQILLFGYAARLEPENTSVAIAGELGSELARRVVTEAGGFRLVAVESAGGAARHRLDKGEARIAIELPSAAVPSRATTIVIDDSELAPARAAAARLERTFWRQLALERNNVTPRYELEWLHNPNARPDWNIAPGLIGVIVMISMLLLGALSIAKERERGSWPSIVLAPVAPFDALLGKLAPYLLIGVVQAVLALGAAVLLFALPVRGSAFALVALATLLALFHVLVGFGISALARTQLQSVQAAVFFYLPNMLLSGFLFPFDAMPAWAKAIGGLLPLTHFVAAARGICITGWQTGRVASEAIPLALATLAALGFALAAFRYNSRDLV